MVCMLCIYFPPTVEKNTLRLGKNVVWPLNVTQVEVFAFAKSVDELLCKNVLLYCHVS